MKEGKLVNPVRNKG